MMIDPDVWTLEDWIIRGLVMSCITADTLYRWVNERIGVTKGAHALDRDEFERALGALWADGFVSIHTASWGWELTDKGIERDPLHRGR